MLIRICLAAFAVLFCTVCEARTYRTKTTTTVIHRHVHEYVAPTVTYSVAPVVTYVAPTVTYSTAVPLVQAVRPLKGGERRRLQRSFIIVNP
jgi:hypothetical protein